MNGVDLTGFLEGKVQIWGAAPAGAFSGAPEGHRPKDLLEGARSVVVFGIAVPRGSFRSPRYRSHFLHRSYHTVYPRLDGVGLELALFMEEAGHEAVAIPSYAPLVFRGAEPWGLLSLRHAAQLAGLGTFGRSGMIYHPVYGSRLRLGAVVTTAEVRARSGDGGRPGDAVSAMEVLCPEGCTRCADVCPAGAISEEDFNKMACLSHSVRHAIYPLALRDEGGRRNIELVVNTAGYDYWIRCFECIKACPLDRLD